MKSKSVLVILMLSVGLWGCSVVTDFDDSLLDIIDTDDGGAGGEYVLRDVLANPVTVVVNSDMTATLDLELAQPFPDVADDEAMGLITKSVITLRVENISTGTDFSLTAGSHVDTPEGPGQYSITIDEPRTTISIVFYNEINGKSLQVGGSYKGLIAVKENQTNIKIETFEIGVQVVAGS